MFLSYIIPLYNCGPYIGRCLDMILSSPLESSQYEVIIINDGSKDDGPQICAEYAQKNTNIRLLNQENQGASAARNAGLDVAQGDYIWFVDGDDGIVPEFVLKAWQLLQTTTVDMLCFNHQKVFVDHTSDIIEFNQAQNISGLEFLKKHYTSFIWNKIYRRKTLTGKRFLTGTKNIEDMLFNMHAVVEMEHVMCVPECGYLYNCTNISSTSRNLSLRNLVKLDLDSVCVLSSLKELADSQSDNEKKCALWEHLNFSITGHLFSLFKFYSAKRLKKRIEGYQKMGLYPVAKGYNKKGNLFLTIANRKWLILSIMRLGMMLKRR